MIPNSHRRLAFTLAEMFAVFVVLGVILALILPAVQSARESQRRVHCSNLMKQLGLGLLNYEDKRKFLPPISTNSDLIPDVPGDATATTDVTHRSPGTASSSGAGYSWLVLLLPEWCNGSLYQSIINNSQKFSLPAFSPAIQFDPGQNFIDVSTYEMKEYLCPSVDGTTTLDNSPRVAGGVEGPVETGTLPPRYITVIARPKGAGGIAITSYNAILGTHLDAMAGTVFPARSASLDNSNNGGMKFRGTAFDQGFRLAELADGLSKVPERRQLSRLIIRPASPEFRTIAGRSAPTGQRQSAVRH
jgi:type II secretory pathway pseudopilin PulG